MRYWQRFRRSFCAVASSTTSQFRQGTKGRSPPLLQSTLLFRISEFGFWICQPSEAAVPTAARFETAPSEQKCFSIPWCRVSQSVSPPHCESAVPHPSKRRSRPRPPVVRCAKRCLLRRRKHRRRDVLRRQYECLSLLQCGDQV